MGLVNANAPIPSRESGRMERTTFAHVLKPLRSGATPAPVSARIRNPGSRDCSASSYLVPQLFTFVSRENAY